MKGVETHNAARHKYRHGYRHKYRDTEVNTDSDLQM